MGEYPIIDELGHTYYNSCPKYLARATLQMHFCKVCSLSFEVINIEGQPRKRQCCVKLIFNQQECKL